jgi:dehydrogenase/reductase SDR family member 7B
VPEKLVRLRRMSYFKHKRIWITGASSGIGEALAKACSKAGAHVILSARNEAELQRVAGECAKLGAASIIVQPLDLGNYQALPSIAQELFKRIGKLDILINNGGISQRSLAKDTSIEVDRRLMEVNYLGTVALTKAVLPNMLLHQLGHIVTITSLMGKFGAPLRSAYAGAKHALHGFFDSLRAELHQTPIKITLICPGYVRTNISVNALTADGRTQGTMDDATNKGLSPDELAVKILYAIERGKREAVFGGKEVIGVWLKRFFPGYLAKVVATAKVT